jgi:hypothetical protein
METALQTDSEEALYIAGKTIRKIVIAMKGFDMIYTNPQVDRQGKEVISGISQDAKLFELRQDNVFYLWRKKTDGSLYIWKKLINLPVLVEYEDELEKGLVKPNGDRIMMPAEESQITKDIISSYIKKQ